jgi:hypothetical protein
MIAGGRRMNRLPFPDSNTGKEYGRISELIFVEEKNM